MKYLLLSLFLMVGCSTSVETSETANGQRRHLITCKNYVQRCYDRASETCPEGYLVLNRVRGVKVDDHTEFQVRIKCRGSKVFF